MNINIFDPNNTFFNNECSNFQINGADIPIKARREQIFPNITANCGLNCTPKFVNNSTMTCDCHNLSPALSNNLVQYYNPQTINYSSSKFMVFMCSVSLIFNKIYTFIYF